MDHFPFMTAAISTGTVALAEIGDKTQLLALLLAARFRKPLPIVAGILVATLLNHALAGWFGTLVAQWLTPEVLRWVVAASFLAVALWTLKPDKLDDGAESLPARGAFVATTFAFFLAEIGDKTQVATVLLAAKYQPLWEVVVGTTIGMLLANVPVVLLGSKLADRLPLRAARYTAAVVFLRWQRGRRSAASPDPGLSRPRAALCSARLLGVRARGNGMLGTGGRVRDVVAALLARPDEIMLEIGAGGELMVARLRVVIAAMLLVLPVANALGGGSVNDTLIGLGGAVVVNIFAAGLAGAGAAAGAVSAGCPSPRRRYDVTATTVRAGASSPLDHLPAGVNSMIVWCGYLLAIALTALRNDGRVDAVRRRAGDRASTRCWRCACSRSAIARAADFQRLRHGHAWPRRCSACCCCWRSR